MNPRYRSVTIKSSNLLVERFERVVENNYRDRHFDLTRMAAEMGMSERQLQRRLRSLTGQTPTEVVRTYRLSKSLEHLLSGASVRDTALAVGFSSQAYFTSCFKAEYGRTPTEYRERRNILN
jgi:AraC-like DNA-binding protein